MIGVLSLGTTQLQRRFPYATFLACCTVGVKKAQIFRPNLSIAVQVIENIFKLRDGEQDMEIVGDMRASLIDEMA